MYENYFDLELFLVTGVNENLDWRRNDISHS